MTTLIKFTGKEDNWQCVDNMKNKAFKEWIYDNCDQILFGNEVACQEQLGNTFFEWGNFGSSSRINGDEEVEDLMKLFYYKDYDELKEKTIEYTRFVWANLHDIKECFEPEDVNKILEGCI